jgi:uncharacterized membrane protein
MDAIIGVIFLWLLFGGTHVGLTVRGVRAPLVARLGESGFRAVYSAVAVATFAALVRFYAMHRMAGPAGLDLGRHPAVRIVLMGAVVAGLMLMFLMDYTRSPSALFSPPIRPPHGAERITRHPFFAGVAAVALAHALLATHAVGTVFFAGLATLAIGGAWHQDRKLLAKRGPAYAGYVAATSAIPFAAIVAGRQPFRPAELPLAGIATGIALAAVLRTVHGSIMAHDGAWVIGGVVGGAAVAGLLAWRRAARPARITREAPAARVP